MREGALRLAEQSELAHRGGEVAARRGEGEVVVVRHLEAELPAKFRDLAQECVDGLVGRARVQPDRDHLLGRQQRARERRRARGRRGAVARAAGG